MFHRATALFNTAWRRRMVAIFLCVGIVLGLVLSVAQSTEAIRFQDRGMYINSARAGDSTHYIISFQYPTANSVGSLLFEFCDTPIPSLPCNPPPGIDVSGATLSAQSGETGFAIANSTNNLLLLSRTPSVTGLTYSSYRLDNVINPNGDPTSSPELEGEKTNFYVRITDYASMDASGPLIDFGSVSATITPEMGLYTQVPPILIFCVAGVINDEECEDTDINYVDFGELTPDQTYFASSEILARTNGRFGYAISVTGKTMTSGVRFIPELTTPTESLVGVGQFGINLTTNTSPAIGADPVGPATNVVLNPDYTTPDRFLFRDGDVLVTSDGVTRVKKYTASYILNVPADQRPGVYSTTITYICLAGF